MVRKVMIGLLAFLPALGAAQQQNHWEYKGGWIEVTRGWLEWEQNDVDGRYCLFSGHSHWQAENDVWCYQPATNQWEEVHPGDQSSSRPYGGDLHAWEWDPVGQEYYLFDGSKVGSRAFAFDLTDRTWREITEYPGIEDRTFINSAGSASSTEHGLMVITHGTRYLSNEPVVRYLDLRNKVYTEDRSDIPPNRIGIQQQFLYIPSLEKFLLFGGKGQSGWRNDLWLLDPETREWEQVAQSNAPPPTAYGQMAYDGEQNIVYLTRGGSARVWILHLATMRWEQLPLPEGTQNADYPGARHLGVAIFDPAAGYCTVAGKVDGQAWHEEIRTWCFRHAVQVDETPPGSPGDGVTEFVRSNLGDLTADWWASPDDPAEVDHYELQRSEDGGTSWIDAVTVPAGNGPSYSYTYEGVVQGPVRVRAVDEFGNNSQFIMLE